MSVLCVPVLCMSVLCVPLLCMSVLCVPCSVCVTIQALTGVRAVPVLGLCLCPVLEGRGQLGGDLQSLPGGSHEVQLAGHLLVVHVLHAGLRVEGAAQLARVLDAGADVAVNTDNKT